MNDGERGIIGKTRAVNAPPSENPRTEKALRDANNYLSLGKVLIRAQEQASHGKGHARHVIDGAPFEEQLGVWMQEQGFDFARGQAVKKLHESLRMDAPAAVKEMLGAINYIAMAIIALESKGGIDEQEENRP